MRVLSAAARAATTGGGGEGHLLRRVTRQSRDLRGQEHTERLSAQTLPGANSCNKPHAAVCAAEAAHGD